MIQTFDSLSYSGLLPLTLIPAYLFSCHPRFYEESTETTCNDGFGYVGFGFGVCLIWAYSPCYLSCEFLVGGCCFYLVFN